MPTSITRGGVADGRPLPGIMFPPSYRSPMVLIGPWSWEACGEELTGMAANSFASTSYPAGNRVIAYPFEIADSFLVRKLWVAIGTTVGVDGSGMAVYAEDGTRVIASTAGAGGAGVSANLVNEDDVTDTLLAPGRYWMAYSQSGTSTTPLASATPVALLRAMGCAQMAGATPPGATFTPAAIASAVLPAMGIAGRTQVA